MIVNFNFKNFKSFKDEMEFTAFPVKSDKKNLENIIAFDLETNFIKESNNQLLKQIAIYGANASGKSNFIKALNFLKKSVLHSYEDRGKNPILSLPYFKLVESWEYNPSEFQIVFIKNRMLYTYGFIVEKYRITEEWLYRKNNIKKSKDVCIFKRKGTSLLEGIDSIMRLSSPKEILKNKESSLFISILKLLNNQENEIVNVLNFFQENLKVEETVEDTEIMGKLLLIKAFIESEKKGMESNSLKLFKKFIQAIDTRIQDIKIIKISDSFEDSASEEKIIENYKIKTKHHIYNSEKDIIGENWFDFEDESSGTQKLINVALIMISSIFSQDTVLVLDEFDTKIHPLIFSEIIKLYRDSKVNNQIIFATHNTSILNTELLRRDQIYFVEKNYNETSEIYSLSDFKAIKVRNDESYEKRYLEGRYQGVPLIDFTDFRSEIAGDISNEEE